MPYNIDVPKSKKQRRLNFIITIILNYFIDISPSYECTLLFCKACALGPALQYLPCNFVVFVSFTKQTLGRPIRVGLS